MRRYLGVILAVAVVLALLVALSAAGFVSFDRPPESEVEPHRSTYNPGPTGVRAFYQLLEESGYDVARWREPYKVLNRRAGGAEGAALVVVGPFRGGPRMEERPLPPDELLELKRWVSDGGRLLVISREPQAQFGDGAISAQTNTVDNVAAAKPEDLVSEHGDVLIAQPTELTRGVKGLAVSKLASRLKFLTLGEPPVLTISDAPDPSVGISSDSSPGAPPTPAASPTPEPSAEPPQPGGVPAEGAPQWPELKAPVVHLGDAGGAVLADFEYGKGRIIFLADPFVVANNGVARGANLRLALNLIHALGGGPAAQGGRRVLFDEYHHGYESRSNSVVAYFRGTPVLWVCGQLALVAVLLAYAQGRRFARPLPLAQSDRHSPLEFVGSMANLQQAARARDLALENIYPRFRAKVCRAVGLPASAPAREIAARLKRRVGAGVSEAELQRVFAESERALAGAPITDEKLVELVAAMRRVAARIG
jgi:hypothetical protein